MTLSGLDCVCLLRVSTSLWRLRQTDRQLLCTDETKSVNWNPSRLPEKILFACKTIPLNCWHTGMTGPCCMFFMRISCKRVSPLGGYDCRASTGQVSHDPPGYPSHPARQIVVMTSDCFGISNNQDVPYALAGRIHTLIFCWVQRAMSSYDYPEEILFRIKAVRKGNPTDLPYLSQFTGLKWCLLRQPWWGLKIWGCGDRKKKSQVARSLWFHACFRACVHVLLLLWQKSAGECWHDKKTAPKKMHQHPAFAYYSLFAMFLHLVHPPEECMPSSLVWMIFMVMPRRPHSIWQSWSTKDPPESTTRLMRWPARPGAAARWNQDIFQADLLLRRVDSTSTITGAHTRD